MEDEKQEEDKTIEQRKSKLNKFFFGWIKDNYDKVFIAILIVAFIIRFLIFLKTMNQPLWWDTASYMATAKKWGLGLNVSDIWYYRRGFLWPLLSSISFKLSLDEAGVRFLTVLFSTGIVAVSYFLIKEIFNKKTALFTSLCLTFSWVFLFFNARPMTSTPAAFFVLLSLLFFWKGYVKKQGKKFIYLFGLFYALSVLTRMQYLMFALPITLFIFAKEKFKFIKNKHLWIALGIFSLAFLPHAIMYSQHFGFFLLDILTFNLGIPGLSKLGQIGGRGEQIKIFKYFPDLPYALSKPIFLLFIIGGFLFLINLVLGLDKIFKNEKIQKRFFVASWVIISMMVLGYMSAYPQQRYEMPIFPFFFAIATIPLSKLINLFSKHSKSSKKTLTIISFIILLMLLIYPAWGAFANSPSNWTWGNSLIENKKTSYGEVKQAGIWIKENSNPEDIIVSTSFPQTAYYSERSTFEFGSEGNPEDKRPQNRTGFEEFVEQKKPRYLMVSAFQGHPGWVDEYLQENQNIFVPVQVYSQEEQPVLIIYEINYLKYQEQKKITENNEQGVSTEI